MKKKIIHIAFALGIASLTLTSCEDIFGGFLDKQPSNELTEQEVFGDWNLMVQFHYDTYNFLRHGARRINDSWLDSATDLGTTSYSTGGTRTSFNIGNYYGASGAPELTATWEHYYRGIRKCNYIIRDIEKVPQSSDDSDEKYKADKLTYTSEARFLRAYFYWELFLRYGPVPLVTDVLDPDGDLFSDYTTRPTIKEYMSFVTDELEKCEEGLLSYEDAWNPARAGRLSQCMVPALLSRIYLYMASPRFAEQSGVKWDESIKKAEAFFKNYGSHFELYRVTDSEGNLEGVESYTNAILNTIYQGGNREVIFFRNDATVGWGAISSDTPVGEGGNGGLCPSQNLVDMYDMLDGSSPFVSYDATGAPIYVGVSPTINPASGYSDETMWENRDPRLTASVLHHGVAWGNGTINVISGQRDNPVGNTHATPTGYYVRKYIPESILGAEHSGSGYRNWVIIRYSEILLNYAEAMNEVNGPCQAVYDCLDAIRGRAAIQGSVSTRSDLTSSKEAMRHFIHKERTIELAFEEHRAWDVRRWNVAKEALSRPIYGIEVAQDGSITRKESQKRTFEPKMYLYPIPEGEVWKTSIENNQGW
ncbi:MAG: RagB/SusD family nutrient uptake outer membrane protein [Phocaeicola sp.]